MSDEPAATLSAIRATDRKREALVDQLGTTRASDKRARLQRGIDKLDAERRDLSEQFRAGLVHIDRPTVERLDGIVDELDRLAARSSLSADDERYAAQLEAEAERACDELIAADRRERADDVRRDRVLAAVTAGRGVLHGSQPDAEPESNEPAHRAFGGHPMSSIDTHRAGPAGDALSAIRSNAALTDQQRDVVAALVERDDTGSTAGWAAAAADPDYVRAFAKLARDPQNGHRGFTTAELAAYQRAETVTRALNLTSGSALVPTHLDPSVHLSSAGSVDPFREIATVATVGTDSWNGVTSEGVTTEWLEEEAEAADASPTFTPAPIPVHKAAAFIPISIEALGDMENVGSEVGRLLADGKAQHEAPAFVSGDGDGKPTGLLEGLGSGQTVDTAATGAFAPADVYALIEALPPRFRANARWLAALPTINTLDQAETDNGAKLFPRVGDADPVLLRRRLHEHSELDDEVTAGNSILVVGDFSQYVIVDRVGFTVELVPHLFGANRRPTGQRGWFAYWRVGGDARVPNAFRVLNVASS